MSASDGRAMRHVPHAIGCARSMRRPLLLLFCCLFALCGAPLAFAETSVSGEITSNTTWTESGSPYVISADVSVLNGATLTIQAGTTIYMAAGTSLTVNAATLDARGTAGAPITVLSDALRTGGTASPGDWNHWIISAGATATLEHFVVRHGKGLRIEDSSPTLNYVVIQDHSGPAIAIDLAASPSGVSNQASGNQINGVLVPPGDIGGSVRWGIRGIPYVVSTGIVSVGASPRIDSVSPAIVQAGETIETTVSGSRLGGVVSASFGDPDVTAEILPGATDTSVLLSVSAGASAEPGSRDLVLLVDAGYATGPAALTVGQAVPRIDNLDPAELYTTLGDRSVVVTGINFLETSVAELDGTPIPTAFVSSTRLDASVPDPVAAGSRSLRLRTPNPSGSGDPLLSNEATLTAIEPRGTADPAEPSMFDGGSSTVTLTLPFAAPAGGLSFEITSSAPSIAYGPSSLLIAEGETAGSFAVQAAGVGEAVLTVSRAGWDDLTITVTVVEPPRTLNLTPIVTPLVGVTVGDGAAGSTSKTLLQTASHVGVIVGSVAKSVSPGAGVIGTEVTLKVQGERLDGVTSVSLDPADGVTLSAPSVSADAREVSVVATIAETAPQVSRRVVLQTASARVPFADPAKASFLVTAPVPVLESITPQVLQAGTASAALVVRGTNLKNVQGVRFEPPDGLTVSGTLTTNAQGTQLDFSVQVAADAPSGSRTLIVTSAAGDSDATPTAGNTVHVAREVGPTYSAIATAMVGVLVGEEAPAAPLAVGPVTAAVVGVQVGESAGPGSLTVTPVTAPLVGVAVGATATSVTPRSGVIDTQLTLTVSGSGLSAVTGIALSPPDGTSFGALTVSSDGRELSAPLTIDAAAPQTLRRVVLTTANGPVAFSDPAKASFVVSAPVAELQSITPQIVEAGAAAVSLTVRGVRMNNLSAVRVEPASGAAVVGTPTVNAEGTVLTVSVQADAGAPSGPRTLIVTTAAGESSNEPTAGNTFYVAQETGATYAAISTPLVGVQLGDAAAPAAVTRLEAGPTVGIVVGPIVTNLSPRGSLKGTSGELLLSGVGLTAVDAVSLETPDAEITLGTPVVNTEGTQVNVPVSVSAAAATQLNRVRLSIGGAHVPAAAPDADLWLVLDQPTIESVSPTVLQQGKTYTFDVRGEQLQTVERIAFEPANDVLFEEGISWSTDSLGEKLSVRVVVDPAAATGPRVVRLHYPGGATGSQPTSANTINVVSPQ